MHLPSLTACVLLLSSGATALKHGEQDNGMVQALWEVPHVAAHHQCRDGFIIADGKCINRRTHAKLHARQPPPPTPGPPPPPPPGQAPGGSWEDKPSAPSHVKVGELWRGETFRKPEDVRKAGGFASHAKRIFEGTHPEYKTGMTQEAFKLGSSLYHHSKKTCSCSSYVSMSASKDEATNFAGKQTAERTYVYKIRPETSRVVDVAGSLGGGRHLTWTREKEIAGVYEVPWKQVIGWHEGTPTKAEGGGSELVFSEFINKADVYPDDPLPKEVPLTGEFEIRPELAGFPEGHLGRTELPWKEFNDVPVEEWLTEYMMDRNFNKVRTKFKEARKAAEWAELPFSCLKRKRARAPSPCGRVKNPAAEGEEVTKPGNVEGEETEKPGNGGGEEIQPENKGSEWEIEKTPPEKAYPERLSEDQLLEASEKFTEEEFPRLAAKFGLKKLFSRQRNPLSFNKVKASLKGYEPLSAAPAKIKPKLGKIKPGKALLAVGAALWVKDMRDVFSRNSSASERAVVTTSILPLVGCAVQTGVDAAEGKQDNLDNALCFLGDGLTLTPAWPLGVAVHGLRLVIKAVPERFEEARQYREWQNEQVLTLRRIEGWRQRRDEILKHFKSNNLTANVQAQYEAEQLVILYGASQAAGGLHAGSLKIATAEERPQVENTTKYVGQEELEQQICDRVYQSKYLIIKDMENGTFAFMQNQQRQYDDQFFKHVKDALDSYQQPVGFGDDFPDPNVFAKIHSEYISKVRSISYPGKLLPDQERMEFQRLLDEKLELPLQCRDRESLSRKYPRPDWNNVTSEWIDHYCTRDSDDLLANFTQAKAELVKQGGGFAESFDLSTDGCSEPGTSLEDNPSRKANLSFRPACERHDFCYRNFKAQERFNIGEKVVIDEIFRKDMLRICQKASNRRPCKINRYSDCHRLASDKDKCENMAEKYYTKVQSLIP